MFDAGPAPLVAVWGISDIVAGAEWFALCGSPRARCDRGPVSGPGHPRARRARPAGVLHRESLVQALAPDRGLIEQIRWHIATAAEPDSPELGYRRSAHHDVAEHRPQRNLRAALELLGCCREGRPVRSAQLACLAGLIGESSVRDCLFAVANTAHATAAEATWALLVRGLTGPNRANAAVLLAYRGHGSNGAKNNEVRVVPGQRVDGRSCWWPLSVAAVGADEAGDAAHGCR
ncbi:DUF4192 family protein [Nocardia cyriacigeorgica]|uniref:DUF4192 family protein n=1 Tax=Nocardia cyriacigeorgica TaxID=135487 RepID=UPI0034D681DF